ncbi:hypothetical protein AB6Q56_06010 [Dechloromonas sp. ARDL1]|uniref:hypothetical protein n=1 Tax=Dechloromonas sp. ARDL1 TaxID=3322121 RepID=UPI003DA761E3
MPRPREHIRDFPGKRWLNVALRTVHLLGIVLFGAALLGAASIPLGAALTLTSGLGMFAVDTWANPAHLREVAGFGMLVKLALIALATLQPALALPVFWTLIVLSTLLSHAPGNFRHCRLF